MADISGRAPSKKGSFVIDLSAREPDKFAYEFDPTELRAYDPIGLLRDHFKIAGRALYERCAEISDKWGGLTILPPSGEPSISPHDAAVEKSEATAREIEFILAHCESSLAGTLAETYYRARGLETPLCDNVLFHPSLAPWPGASRGYPAIVARVLTPEGHETGGIHRTFLKDDGSHHIGGDQPNGPRAEAKMMLGPVRGGAIHYQEPDPKTGELLIGEGSESTLSAQRLYYDKTGRMVPTWAMMTAGGMGSRNKEGVTRGLAAWFIGNRAQHLIKRVVVCIDGDEAGRTAGAILIDALQRCGVDFELYHPSADGRDFNDDLLAGRPMGDPIPCGDGPIEPELPGLAHERRLSGAPPASISLDDFYAYMPMHNYIFIPTGATWPAGSVNSRLPPVAIGADKFLPAAAWLDKNRPVEQMTWVPGFPQLIADTLILEGGLIHRPGSACFNLYRPPIIAEGDPAKAAQWVDHVRHIYPADADHIIDWFAHRAQQPQDKINHALVLGGPQGIGKDTVLAPVQYAIGAWNFQEASPEQILGRFNGFLKSVILRVSEARDLGDFDRFKLYDHMKTLTASPPETLRVDEKNLREYRIANVCGVVITTNHRVDGLYLASDDRRHYVAWSDCAKESFVEAYWADLWKYYEGGGFQHVAAFLRQRDISKFNPKAPPSKTAAWWAIVDHSVPSEGRELADLLDHLKKPPAVALGRLQSASVGRDGGEAGFSEWLNDRKNRRAIPHRMEQCGYLPVRNPDAADGLWVVGGRRQTVYVKRELSADARIEAAKLAS
jgi:hypothetical protein